MHAQETKEALFRLNVQKLIYNSDEKQGPSQVYNLSVNSEIFATAWNGLET